MSILIKDMEIPQTCEDCTLESYCGLWIEARRLCGETFTDAKSRVKATIRHPDCPLVEVPPHGDLIDRDDLMSTLLNKTYGVDINVVMKQIMEKIISAPTIIEAEGEDANL